tara:strand:+ start:911 stop:1936 length:1026 start_codon:yes stop_codon:yes gene_type:complete
MAKVNVKKQFNKEEYIDFFHQYTNNIFKDKLPDDFETTILTMVNGKTNTNNASRESQIISLLINPIYQKYSKNVLKLTSKKLPSNKLDKRKEIVKLPNKKAVYITNLLSGSNKLMAHINIDDYGEDFKGDYDYIVSILDVLKENVDNQFRDYKKELKSEYSILIIDVTKSILKTNLIRATDISKGCIYFWKGKFHVGTKFLPIIGYNPHLPEGQEQEPFIHSLKDTLDIFPKHREELSGKSEVIPKMSKLGVVPKEPEKPVSKIAIKLSYNPYDNNQYLRLLTLEGLKTNYLQGRSKYDEKEDKFNLYEDSEENKLVGVMSIPEGDSSKAVINWCTNYSPK